MGNALVLAPETNGLLSYFFICKGKGSVPTQRSWFSRSGTSIYKLSL